MDKLEQARKRINQIDQQMASLFEARMNVVKDVVNYKIEHKKEVLDQTREKELIKKNMTYLSDNSFKSEYFNFLNAVMEVSRNYQKKVINKDKIGYAGTYGAFAYIASNHIFPQHEFIAFSTFEEVIHAVEVEEVHFGVIPFENSFTGEVGEVSDLLFTHDVFIRDMYDLKVDQNLLGIKGSKTSGIKKVYSHPQALSQSNLFLKGRDIERIEHLNTALAAELVSELQDPSIAAIASRDTAELFDLEILEENIQSSVDNTTRFAIIGKELCEVGSYFQMLFTTKNETGALARAMNLIASFGFNMESIKSRAIPMQPWAYYFHVELQGKLSDEQTKNMLRNLKDSCERIKILGSYQK